jgi:hypothetical protein
MREGKEKFKEEGMKGKENESNGDLKCTFFHLDPKETLKYD